MLPAYMLPPMMPFHPQVKNWMRKPVVTKSVLLVNGTDIPGGVEYGSDLVLHPRWGLNLMFVSSVVPRYTKISGFADLLIC